MSSFCLKIITSKLAAIAVICSTLDATRIGRFLRYVFFQCRCMRLQNVLCVPETSVSYTPVIGKIPAQIQVHLLIYAFPKGPFVV